MQIQASISPSDRLPVKGSLINVTILSLLVAGLTAVVSIAGLLYQNTIYPTEELRQSFVANDVINLVIGLPILFGAIWLARHGRLTGLLIWPGSLLYSFYNYIAYIVGRPFDWLTVIFLGIVVLSAYAAFDILNNIDRKAVQETLTGAVPRKTAGWSLILFGILFLFLAVSLVVGAITNQEPLPLSDLGVSIADVILSIFLIAGGVLLLQQKPLGYASGLGLLFGASMLFAGVIVFVLVRPLLTDVPFDAAELVTLLIMTLVFIVPFALFLRGVLSKESQ